MTLDVPIKLEGSSVYLRDVSISGAQIECDRVLEIGSRADLSLNIPADYHRFFGEKRQISLQMDVKWCNPHPTIPDLYEAGGEITSIEDQSKRDLFSYLSFFCGPLDVADQRKVRWITRHFWGGYGAPPLCTSWVFSM